MVSNGLILQITTKQVIPYSLSLAYNFFLQHPSKVAGRVLTKGGDQVQLILNFYSETKDKIKN
jgi:hypothetical protein